MKILWFNHRDIRHPRAGGAEKTIYEVSRRLVRAGNEVNISSVNPGGLKGFENIDGVNVFRIWGNITAHLYVPKMIRKTMPDVIVDDLAHAVPWGSENFKRSIGTVFFHHLHRRSLKGQVSGLANVVVSSLEVLYPFIYREWPFVTESNKSKEDLIALGIRKERVSRILPGLNLEDFLKFDKSKRPSLVYFGGHRDYKRPWESVFALKELTKSRNDIHLSVVGTGPSLDEVKRISRETGLDGNVSFLGRVSESDLKEIVGGSWVNIHTAVAEGFGFSIIEASALGTPTVAYDVPGVNEAVENNKNGILVRDRDRMGLAQAILDIIDNFPDNWLNNSIQTVKKYSWDKTAEQWEKHLNALQE